MVVEIVEQRLPLTEPPSGLSTLGMTPWLPLGVPLHWKRRNSAGPDGASHAVTASDRALHIAGKGLQVLPGEVDLWSAPT